MSAFLEARHVTKVFGHGAGATVAISDFSYRIDDDVPSITAIAGESGSGKSTVARLLLGFERPTRGQVLYRGKDLRDLSRPQRRDFRREVQAIFQDPFGVYNPFYRVDHLLMMPVKHFRLARNRREATPLIDAALRTVGLNPADILGRYPHQLSGGQRQRITIARALLLKPRLIVADEPVSMIDASLRATILESLRSLYRDFGISFIYITHDLTTAYQIAERLIVLFRGGVAEAGPVARVIKNPQHPYTQLLIRSIPLPDPDQRWLEEATPADDQALDIVDRGCTFAPHCPHAMSICRAEAPPLFHSAGSAVACYLYRDAPPLGKNGLAALAGRAPGDRAGG
jgi:peptide/nickel transport system ATP-binding protein